MSAGGMDWKYLGHSDAGNVERDPDTRAWWFTPHVVVRIWQLVHALQIDPMESQKGESTEIVSFMIGDQMQSYILSGEHIFRCVEDTVEALEDPLEYGRRMQTWEMWGDPEAFPF